MEPVKKPFKLSKDLQNAVHDDFKRQVGSSCQVSRWLGLIFQAI